jgi:hypothetical protein
MSAASALVSAQAPRRDLTSREIALHLRIVCPHPRPFLLKAFAPTRSQHKPSHSLQNPLIVPLRQPCASTLSSYSTSTSFQLPSHTTLTCRDAISSTSTPTTTKTASIRQHALFPARHRLPRRACRVRLRRGHLVHRDHHPHLDGPGGPHCHRLPGRHLHARVFCAHLLGPQQQHRGLPHGERGPHHLVSGIAFHHRLPWRRRWPLRQQRIHRRHRCRPRIPRAMTALAPFMGARPGRCAPLSFEAPGRTLSNAPGHYVL